MTQDSFIASFTVEDLRFPTSLTGDGTDANNRECDYSAAYCTLRTNLGEVGSVGEPALPSPHLILTLRFSRSDTA